MTITFKYSNEETNIKWNRTIFASEVKNDNNFDIVKKDANTMELDDIKLRKTPIVFTEYLEEMKIFQRKSFGGLGFKDIIESIIKESKPTFPGKIAKHDKLAIINLQKRSSIIPDKLFEMNRKAKMKTYGRKKRTKVNITLDSYLSKNIDFIINTPSVEQNDSNYTKKSYLKTKIVTNENDEQTEKRIIHSKNSIKHESPNSQSTHSNKTNNKIVSKENEFTLNERDSESGSNNSHPPNFQHILIVMENSFENLINIYYIDELSHLISHYKICNTVTNKQKLYDDIEPVVKIIEENCCWYKSEKNIAAIKSSWPKANDEILKFMRKPHKCLANNCICCCVTRSSEKIKPSSSILHSTINTIPKFSDNHEQNALNQGNLPIPHKFHGKIKTFLSYNSTTEVIFMGDYKTQRCDVYELNFQGEILSYYKITKENKDGLKDRLKNYFKENNTIVLRNYVACCRNSRENVINNLINDDILLLNNAINYCRVVPNTEDERHLCCKLNKNKNKIIKLVDIPLAGCASHAGVDESVSTINIGIGKIKTNTPRQIMYSYQGQTNDPDSSQSHALCCSKIKIYTHHTDDDINNKEIASINPPPVFRSMYKLQGIRLIYKENGKIGALLKVPLSSLNVKEVNVLSELIAKAQNRINITPPLVRRCQINNKLSCESTKTPITSGANKLKRKSGTNTQKQRKTKRIKTNTSNSCNIKSTYTDNNFNSFKETDLLAVSKIKEYTMVDIDVSRSRFSQSLTDTSTVDVKQSINMRPIKVEPYEMPTTSEMQEIHQSALINECGLMTNLSPRIKFERNEIPDTVEIEVNTTDQSINDYSLMLDRSQIKAENDEMSSASDIDIECNEIDVKYNEYLFEADAIEKSILGK